MLSQGHDKSYSSVQFLLLVVIEIVVIKHVVYVWSELNVLDWVVATPAWSRSASHCYR